MLFFAYNTSNQLVNVGQHLHFNELFCPFCQNAVHSLKVIGSSYANFFHTHATDCDPSIEQQLHLLFNNLPPQQFSFKLPSYIHCVESYSINYPDYPNKYFTFPEQRYEVPAITLILEQEDFVKLDVPLENVSAYNFKYDDYSFIAIFNFSNDAEIIPDYFEDLLYYSSTVFEVTHRSANADIFQNGFSIDSVFKALDIAYFRNEHLQNSMRKPQILLHETYLQWVRDQSMQLKQLESEGIIKIR